MSYFISTQDERSIVAPDGHIVAKATSAKDADTVVRALIVMESVRREDAVMESVRRKADAEALAKTVAERERILGRPGGR